MANLRNKIFGLAGASMVFAGMAFGQAATCGAINANGLSQVTRAESATDLVTETVLTCTTPVGVAVLSSAAVAPAAPAAITLFVGAPVTSKLLQTAALPMVQATEALAIVSVACGAASCFNTATAAGLQASIYSVTQGVITPAGIAFTGIATPGLAGVMGASTQYQIQFVNVRVNSTGGASSISEQAFITGSAILNPGAPPSTVVATVAAGLAPAKLSTDLQNTKPVSTSGLNETVCASLALQTGVGNLAALQTGASGGLGGGVIFYVHTGETFQTSFKTQGPLVNATPNFQAIFGNEFLANTETGIVPTGAGTYAFAIPGSGNQATSGTRIKLVFNNVPTGLTLYVPLIVGSDAAGGTLSLTSTETGPFGAPTAVTATSGGSTGSFTLGNGVGQISQLATGTTVTAIYEVTAQSPLTIEAFSIPVFGTAAAGTLAVTTAPMTVTTSFAPVVTSTAAPLANIPSFISLSTALTVANEVSCSTTILFPYVTQGSGYDVGIAIENTSVDNLASSGTKSSATNQSGTCSLNYYGTGGNITPSAAGTLFANSGSTTAFTFTAGAGASNLLSALNPGFTGYIIAFCNFQFAHAYAYIFTNYGTANATVTSYLPIVLPTNTGARAAPETQEN